MAQLKTTRNDGDVAALIAAIEPATTRADAEALCALMEDAAGEAPPVWGTSIAGFGRYHYRYASGSEGDWFLVGFSPRKQNLTVYIAPGFGDHGALLARLGKHSTGKACLYLKRLADADPGVLRDLISRSVEQGRALARG